MSLETYASLSSTFMKVNGRTSTFLRGWNEALSLLAKQRLLHFQQLGVTRVKQKNNSNMVGGGSEQLKTRSFLLLSCSNLVGNVTLHEGFPSAGDQLYLSNSKYSTREMPRGDSFPVTAEDNTVGATHENNMSHLIQQKLKYFSKSRSMYLRFFSACCSGISNWFCFKPFS